MTRIAAVDSSDAATAALLQYLQLAILPYDLPKEIADGRWWVAYDGDHAVAFAALHPSSQWSDAGYLSRAGVLPAYRGQGLQRRLLRVRERAARRHGWNWLVTDTKLNPASANNLIACGYRQFEPSKPWADPEATYWKKGLTK
jgi:GNAT superfamily N-acetyltransferase